MPKGSSRPVYCLHRPSGRAYCRVDGRQVYLGVWDSPESRQRFADLVTEWSVRHDPAPLTLTIDELAVRYMAHADGYYRKRGRPTSEPDNIRQALRPLVRLHGTLRVRDFGPLRLVEVRDEMIRLGFVRSNINRHLCRIRAMFLWGASRELLPVTVHTALKTVSGLRKGRGQPHRAGAGRGGRQEQRDHGDPEAARNAGDLGVAGDHRRRGPPGRDRPHDRVTQGRLLPGGNEEPAHAAEWRRDLL